MSRFKFDFSDVKLVKMPDEKKCSVKKFKKPKFNKFKQPLQPKLKTPEIVTLSDSEELKDQMKLIEEPLDIIDLSESSSDEDESAKQSVEIITLDDSDSFCNNECKQGKVCTTTECPDYIPVPQYVSNKLKKQSKKRKQKQLSPPIVATKGVKRKKKETIKGTPVLKLSHPNIYNGTDQKDTGLRPVVIDGPNVACHYGNGKFDIKGIILVIQYFLSRGHTDITCLLPAHFRHTERSEVDKKIIQAYENDKIVVYTPSRKLVDGKSIIPYDDRFIVQYASLSGGVIISNDGYRDLVHEEASWKETVEKRLINYTFVKDVFMLPKDPLGRTGPSLDEILKFP